MREHAEIGVLKDVRDVIEKREVRIVTEKMITNSASRRNVKYFEPPGAILDIYFNAQISILHEK